MLVSLRQRPLQSHELFGAGVTAGCISSFATTPLDVVTTMILMPVCYRMEDVHACIEKFAHVRIRA